MGTAIKHPVPDRLWCPSLYRRDTE